jgi:transcriptional regulator with XRE-family HTH domain
MRIQMLHKALRTIREVHRMQQGELAEKLGISRSYLSEIESEKKKKPISVELLTRYADVFDVPASTFLSFAEALEGSSEKRKRNAKKMMQILEWTLEKDHDPAEEVSESL